MHVPRHSELRIRLEVIHVNPPRTEETPGFRVYLDDEPIFYGPMSPAGVDVAFDALARRFRGELERLAGRSHA